MLKALGKFGAAAKKKFALAPTIPIAIRLQFQYELQIFRSPIPSEGLTNSVGPGSQKAVQSTADPRLSRSDLHRRNGPKVY